jgi:hypothetical protein
MTKLGCLFAALASVALVSPSLAGDTPAPPFETARQGALNNDDVRANDARSGTMRPNRDRAPRAETRRREHKAVVKADTGVAANMQRRHRHHRQQRDM